VAASLSRLHHLVDSFRNNMSYLIDFQRLLSWRLLCGTEQGRQVLRVGSNRNAANCSSRACFAAFIVYNY
jgi:hypothetical protein